MRPQDMPVDGAEVVAEMGVILQDLARQLAIERVRLRHCVIADPVPTAGDLYAPPNGVPDPADSGL